ncbi:MAG: hypothetical protein RSB13_07120 [Aurantimicrobium sp.]|jgi:hypothetical protein|uniref:hypothetical protein n=1 Tax=Aurantimicrobium TaxID=1705353 RepID=UPI002406B84E|nr:hypothetical protein [Aurantimicrobium minutum]MDF9810312.1 hypothetical protein [Aurantimicrobium minutum]
MPRTPPDRFGFIPLRPVDIAHILDGDAEGGGHRFGANRKKSEFPPGWDEPELIAAVEEIQYRVILAYGSLSPGVFEAVIARVKMRMIIDIDEVSQQLMVATVIPLEGDGVTIWTSGKRKPRPLRENEAGARI